METWLERIALLEEPAVFRKRWCILATRNRGWKGTKRRGRKRRKYGDEETHGVSGLNVYALLLLLVLALEIAIGGASSYIIFLIAFCFLLSLLKISTIY